MCLCSAPDFRCDCRVNILSLVLARAEESALLLEHLSVEDTRALHKHTRPPQMNYLDVVPCLLRDFPATVFLSSALGEAHSDVLRLKPR